MAALVLKRQGLRCRVVERVSRDRLCADVGDGYHIGSTTLAMLDHLGVGQQCRAAGLHFSAFHAYTDTGRPLTRMPIPASVDMVTLRRSALQAVLLDAVGEDVLQCEAGVTGFEQDDGGVDVHLASGEVLRTKLLIGADGVHSKTREAMLGDGPPRFCHVMCCWGRVGEDELGGVANLPTQEAFSQLGPGASVATAHIGEVLLWSVFWHTSAYTKSANLEQQKVSIVERFGHWASPTPELIRATPPEVITEVGIWDRDPCEHWYHGRVVLIGDAAHPMTPFLGQGANSAMLDAYVVAYRLGSKPHQTAFATYQARRKPSTDKNIKTARLICAYSTAERSWKQLAMANLMRLMPARWMLSFMLKADVLNDVSDLLTPDIWVDVVRHA